MKLASLYDGSPDGLLAVISADGGRYLPAEGIAATLQHALEHWDAAEPKLRALSEALSSDPTAGEPLTGKRIAAPLPRAWQWLDGSAFESHGELMDRVLGVNVEKTGRPLMYQGVSDRFYGPNDDVVVPSEDLGIDFEGEFGIITDAVPMGISPQEAMQHIS